MNRFIPRPLVRFVFVMFLMLTALPVRTAELIPELAALSPFLGTWESSMNLGGKQVVDVSHSEIALNGTAIRNLHSINDGDYGGETLIIFDSASEKVLFFYFTTGGFRTEGEISLNDDGSFTAIESVNGDADSVTEVKSTSKLIDGEIHISTQFCKDGEWAPPETRVSRPSDKKVRFR